MIGENFLYFATFFLGLMLGVLCDASTLLDATVVKLLILGMLSLATFEIPTGVRAWVEDVVVDEAARGQGAGQSLVVAAIEHAKKIGARTVDLTSRPSREAANRLYQRAGFQLRETNVYRVTLEQK